MFHYFGLALTVLSWLGSAYILAKWRSKDLQTISRHAASSRQSLLIFAGILVGFGGLFYWWLMRWFAPHLYLGLLFKEILTVAIVLQFAAGIAPDTSGWMRKTHRAAAYCMAALYLPLAWIIGCAPGLSASAKFVCVLCITYMITAGLTFFIGKGRSHYLALQALYIVAFQVTILAAAYI